MGLIALLVVIGAGYWLIKILRRFLKIRKSLLLLRSAKNTDELQRALLNFDNGKAVMQNLTLQQWLQRMQIEYGADERLSVFVRQLEGKQYGAVDTKTGIAELAQELARLMQQKYLQHEFLKYFIFQLQGK